jgi:hypothetical protein
MLTDTRHASLAVLAAFVALLTLAPACTSSAPTPEDLATASLLTLDDLPGEGWVATDITEDDLATAQATATSAMQSRVCPIAAGSSELPEAKASVRLGRAFERPRAEDDPIHESFTLMVTTFDSADALEAYQDAAATAPTITQAEVAACAADIAAFGGFDIEAYPEAPTLSIPDARSVRNVITTTSDRGVFTEIVTETHWITRGRVLAMFSFVEPPDSTVDYQSLLEQFERRVVAAQQ